MHALNFVQHFGHTLALPQTNILVDASGRARVAGLGVANFLQSPTPGVDIDRFFHGVAPELVFPQDLGLTNIEATKESDIYALGVLVRGASPVLECPVGELLNGARPSLRFSLGEFRSPTKVELQGFTLCRAVVGLPVLNIQNFPNEYGR